jgi:hypothetical protein
MTTIYDYDLHDVGKAAFGSILRDAGYDPLASSLTRQAWEYQEKLIDEMGEGMGQSDGVMALAPQAADDLSSRLEGLGVNKQLITSCGAGFLAAAFAGYVSGKVGVLPTAAGVGLAYLILKGMERKQ